MNYGITQSKAWFALLISAVLIAMSVFQLSIILSLICSVWSFAIGRGRLGESLPIARSLSPTFHAGFSTRLQPMKMTMDTHLASITLAVPDVEAYSSFYEQVLETPCPSVDRIQLIPGLSVNLKQWQPKPLDDEYQVGNVLLPPCEPLLRSNHACRAMWALPSLGLLPRPPLTLLVLLVVNLPCR